MKKDNIIRFLKILLLFISLVAFFVILVIYNSVIDGDKDNIRTFDIVFPSMRKISLLLIAQIFVIYKFYFIYDNSTQVVVDYELKNNFLKFILCFSLCLLYTISIPIWTYNYIYLANYESPIIEEATDLIYNTMLLIWIVVEVPVLYIFFTKKDIKNR
jgi:hypothetical protein